MKELVARLAARPALTAEMVAASLFANVLALATPLFTIQVIRRYVAHGVDSTLATLTAGAVIAIILEFGFRQVRLRLVRAVNAPFDRRLAEGAFEMLTGARSAAVSGLDAGRRREAGSAADTIRAAYDPANVATLLDVPFALVFVVALWLISPALAAIAAAFLAAVFLAALLAQADLRRPMRELAAVSGRRNAILSAAGRAADAIRAHNARAYVRRLWSAESARWAALAARVSGRTGLVQTFSGAAQNLMTVAIIGVGGYYVVQGQVDVGALIGANILAARAMMPIARTGQLAAQLARARQAHELLREVARLPLERADGAGIARYEGGLAFEDMGFAHPGATGPLFESLDAAIGPGQVLVIAGGNGTGKTTLARLIVGLIEPTRGRVLADGVELRQIAPEWWRRQVSYLPQEPMFLPGTLRDNLLAANPDLGDDALNGLVRAAGLKTFVDSSPGGLDAVIEGCGENLAFGIRRRLALARALATEGRLLVFDEPAEGFDPDGRRCVAAATARARRRGSTTVICTSDPGVVRDADVVIDLNRKPVPRVVRREPGIGASAGVGPVPAAGAGVATGMATLPPEVAIREEGEG